MTWFFSLSQEFDCYCGGRKSDKKLMLFIDEILMWTWLPHLGLSGQNYMQSFESNAGYLSLAFADNY